MRVVVLQPLTAFYSLVYSLLKHELTPSQHRHQRNRQSLEGPELLSALVHEGITYFRCGVQTLRALGDPRGNVYVPILRIVEGEKRT